MWGEALIWLQFWLQNADAVIPLTVNRVCVCVCKDPSDFKLPEEEEKILFSNPLLRDLKNEYTKAGHVIGNTVVISQVSFYLSFFMSVFVLL